MTPVWRICGRRLEPGDFRLSILMRLILMHGWGYGPSFWQPLRRALPDYDCILLDLGYGDGPVSGDVPPPDGQPRLAIGHSLGAARLLEQVTPGQPPPWDGFVACCGFSRFRRVADFPHGVDPAVLAAMRNRLKRGQTVAALADFHAACGDGAPPDGPWNAPRLDEGLSWLAACDMRGRLAGLESPVLALAARDDAIVLPAMTEAAFAGRADIVWSGGGGHALPKSRPLWCAEQIERFIHHREMV